jgi:prepilin-type N-terminal cleavage/methylation domain-containing protein
MIPSLHHAYSHVSPTAHQRGFSLIEVLVSLSIFAVVMTIAIGSLLALISSNAKTQNMQSVLTNISFALDSMTREIRVGSDYYCGAESSLPTTGEATRDCSSGGPAFAFNEGGVSLTEGTGSKRIGYRLQGGVLERRLGTGSWAPVTAPEIKVETLRFTVTGSTRADSTSPSVTLYLQGTTGDAEDGSLASFDIQTTVVQQLLDI